jgi:hypothetical protein
MTSTNSEYSTQCQISHGLKVSMANVTKIYNKHAVKRVLTSVLVHDNAARTLPFLSERFQDFTGYRIGAVKSEMWLSSTHRFSALTRSRPKWWIRRWGCCWKWRTKHCLTPVSCWQLASLIITVLRAPLKRASCSLHCKIHHSLFYWLGVDILYTVGHADRSPKTARPGVLFRAYAAARR